MKGIISVLQTVIAGIGAFLGWFLGGLDGFLYALIVMVTLDYVSGVMVAITKKELSSEIGANGIFKKILIFALVAIGHVVDTHIVRSGSAIRTAAICYYISNEGISVIENAARLGLKIPKKLTDVLAQISEEDKDEE